MITKDRVNTLWDMLIEDSSLDCDAGSFYKWLIESCEVEDDSKAEIWNVKEIGTLFNEKLGSGSNDFSGLTLDGFECIKSYFFLENETEKKLHRYFVKPDKKKAAYSIVGGYGYAAPVAWNKPKEEDKDVQVLKVYESPENLAGIGNIWRIIIESRVEEVTTKAIDLMIELYKCLSGEITDQARDVTERGVGQAMTLID
jgi:ubiquitin C-terminal hydrolase